MLPDPQLTSSDALDRIRAEGDLAKLNQELEQRVLARTAQLEATNRSLETETAVRQNAEAARQASEERYRTLFDYAPDGIVIADQQSVYLDANASMCRMLGYARAEFIGLHASDIVAPAEIAHIGSALSVLHARSDHQREWIFRRKDGSTFPADVIATQMPDGNLLAVIRDITERNRTDARFRRLVESNAQGVLFWNTKGEITGANDAFLGLLGFTREDLAAGRIAWLAMTPPEYAHLDARALEEITARGVCTPFEKEYIRKDGSRVAILLGAATFEDNPGEGVCFVIDLTARKQAEEAQRESELRFATAFRSSPIAIAINRRRDLINVEVNDSFLRLFDCTREEIVGHTLLGAGLLDGTTVSILRERLNVSGSVDNLELPARTRKGRALHLNLSIRAIQLGGETCALSTVADVTERKRTEQALREKEAQFHAADRRLAEIVHGMTEACFALDLEWRFTFVNDRGETLLRHRREAMLGRTIWEVFHQLVGTPMEANYRRAMTDRAPVSFEVFSPVAKRWLDIRLFPTGEGLAAFLLDIDARKQAEVAVRGSEEYFRFLNDLAVATRPLADPARIMAVTAQMLGEHLRASRCAYADVEADGERFTILHDYTDGCASTVGNYQLSLFGPRALATLHAGATLIIRDVGAELTPGEGAEMFAAIGIKAIITCPLVKAGGLRAMMAVHQATPRDWQPDEIALVREVVERCWATIERRTAEDKILHLNADLERRVEQRTAEVLIGSQKIQTANLQLEAANRELEAFSYSVSHDLRAPLRTIDGYSQAVLEDFGAQLPEEGRRYLQTIREGAQRMGELIDDLLAFARLSRQPLKTRTVDMAGLVREVVEESREEHADRKIEFAIGELPPCEGDPALMKQVWVNLISNAVKYTGQRAEAKVEIGCKWEKGGAVFFVRDNGTGFDMRYAEKLFGVFQRLHRMEDYPGTGVGLAIVQRVVHRHGGRIWADAAVDRGATFYFTLNEKAAS